MISLKITIGVRFRFSLDPPFPGCWMYFVNALLSVCFGLFTSWGRRSLDDRLMVLQLLVHTNLCWHNAHWNRFFSPWKLHHSQPHHSNGRDNLQTSRRHHETWKYQHEYHMKDYRKGKIIGHIRNSVNVKMVVIYVTQRRNINALFQVPLKILEWLTTQCWCDAICMR